MPYYLLNNLELCLTGHPYEFDDPYTPDWLPEYRRRAGVLVDTSDFKAFDFFKLYFPDEVIQLICTETNRYAEHNQKNTKNNSCIPHF